MANNIATTKDINYLLYPILSSVKYGDVTLREKGFNYMLFIDSKNFKDPKAFFSYDFVRSLGNINKDFKNVLLKYKMWKKEDFN